MDFGGFCHQKPEAPSLRYLTQTGGTNGRYRHTEEGVRTFQLTSEERCGRYVAPVSVAVAGSESDALGGDYRPTARGLQPTESLRVDASAVVTGELLYTLDS